MLRSSYIQNKFSSIFQSIITIIKPNICVEFGILDGFSTIIIGSTLKLLGKGHLFSYDLFEEYKYNSQRHDTVRDTVTEMGVENEITLKRNNIFDAVNDFESNSIDFMHVDISNDGGIISRVFMDWNDKIKSGGIIIFEGGSPMRDNISWMNDYNKRKIFPELKSNSILNNNYTYIIIHQFPSLVICSKNVECNSKNMGKYGYNDATEKVNNISKDELSNLITKK